MPAGGRRGAGAVGKNRPLETKVTVDRRFSFTVTNTHLSHTHTSERRRRTFCSPLLSQYHASHDRGARARATRSQTRTHGTFGPVVPGARIGVLEEYARKTRTTSHLRVLHGSTAPPNVLGRQEELAGRPIIGSGETSHAPRVLRRSGRLSRGHSRAAGARREKLRHRVPLRLGLHDPPR